MGRKLVKDMSPEELEKERERNKRRNRQRKGYNNEKVKSWASRNPGYPKAWRDKHPRYQYRSENSALASVLRARLSRAIRKGYKSGSAVQDLGCSIEHLKAYLEGKFEPGMTWGNRGEWHIDHVRPLSSFDLADREQLLKACHYTNLQPLWAKDNLSKGAKQ